MAQRLIFPVDLIDTERRQRLERAAARNGKKLGTWLREVADAAALRAPAPDLPVDVGLDPAPVSEQSHVHAPEVLAWGGSRCSECGLAL